MERLQKLRQELESKRRELAMKLATVSPMATARLALRLPSGAELRGAGKKTRGQRLDRKFEPSATLEEVYEWAQCAGFLPENADKGIEVPERFVLKTSFPVQELNEMNRNMA